MTRNQQLARQAAENRVNSLHPFAKEEFTGSIDEPAHSTVSGFAEDILEAFYEEYGEEAEGTLAQFENITYDIL